MEIATFAGGCFWCTEAIFQRIKGVKSVTPGYSGGNSQNPSYEQVSSGISGFAECLKIEFDPSIISYSELLEIFFKTHNPTQVGGQGNDIGDQYKSAVFYHDEKQKKEVEKKIKDYEKKQTFKGKIITQIIPFRNFYESEDYHKNYYNRNKSAGYCQIVIDPKITKLYRDFGDKIKNEYRE